MIFEAPTETSSDSNSEYEDAIEEMTTENSSSNTRVHLGSKFPQFHGNPDEDLKEWIARVDIAFELHSIPNSKRCLAAVLALKGKAFSWYTTHQEHAKRLGNSENVSE